MATQTTTELPPNLGDIMGAYDEAHWQTYVGELTPDQGVLTRGTVLSMAGTGKLDKTILGNESQAYGVLLDPSIDTAAAQAFSNGQLTGSIAKSGSFRGAALIVGVGTNIVTLTDALRKNDIFVEGPIVAPAAAAFKAEEPAEEKPYVASAESMERKQREEDDERRRQRHNK